MNARCLAAILACITAAAAHADDWPALHHDSAHTGYTSETLRGPLRVAWKRSFEDGPVGTAVEPIVADGKVFVSSLNGSLYALNTTDGSSAWTFTVRAPFLHAPAFAGGRLYAASLDERLYCLDANNGAILWNIPLDGSAAASPTVQDGVVYIGTRKGRLLAIADTGPRGQVRWEYVAPTPILQTVAVAGKRIFLLPEDMVARCLDAGTGHLLWSAPLNGGASARDYYPCVLGNYVVFRTTPAAAVRDALTLPPAPAPAPAKPSPEPKERRKADKKKPGKTVEAAPAPPLDLAVGWLREHPEYQTLFAFRCADGARVDLPVLYTGGRGGVAPVPCAAADRTAYAVWRSPLSGWYEAGGEGAAKACGVGRLDFAAGQIAPLPPANAGATADAPLLRADEALALQTAGGALIITQQDRIAAFDLTTRRLDVLFGARGRWGGGEPSLPWSANEWRGPARGGLAISGGRAYWLTGGSLIALEGEAAR